MRSHIRFVGELSLRVLGEIELREEEQFYGDDDDSYPRRRLRRFSPSPPRWALWLDIAVRRGMVGRLVHILPGPIHRLP